MLLIIESDETLARTLVELARQRGFCSVIASDGAQAVDLVEQVKPDAITLDIELPDVDGWVLLDRLKHNALTRHIPVYVMSIEDWRRRAVENGALGFLIKPVEGDELLGALFDMQSFMAQGIKRLLILGGHAEGRQRVLELVQSGDVESTAIDGGEAALAELSEGQYDCIILCVGPEGTAGLDLLTAIKELRDRNRTPMLVYYENRLSQGETAELHKLAEGMIVKEVHSAEELLAQSALFLHRSQESLTQVQREMLLRSLTTAPQLAGRKVLVVDDDVRNIFALTAVLEHYAVNVLYAENGREALDRLAEQKDIDLVLMDIMMPEMDGYEATRQIRARGDISRVPIVALTAKAMKGDREKCIRAGASDYIMKPVDPDQLVSVLRVWLYR